MENVAAATTRVPLSEHIHKAQIFLHEKFAAKLTALSILLVLFAIFGGVVPLVMALQADKAKDAIRLADLGQIQQAIDRYYKDTKCYPSTIPFGEEWNSDATLAGKLGPKASEASYLEVLKKTENIKVKEKEEKKNSSSPSANVKKNVVEQMKKIYMPHVPQDPNFPASQYVYKNAGGSCPQWGIVFAQLSEKQKKPVCGLASSCRPGGYTDDTWACAVGGTVNCVVFQPTPTPTASPTPLPSTTPAPTFAPLPENETYFIRSIGLPQMYQASLPGFDPKVGDTQNISILARDPNPITSMKVKVVTDNGSNEYDLSMTSQSIEGGYSYETWAGSWTVPDTHNQHYEFWLVGTSPSGSSHTEIIVR